MVSLFLFFTDVKDVGGLKTTITALYAQKEENTMKKIVALFLSLCLLLGCTSAIAEAPTTPMPEASGKNVKKNGDLVIDCSHMDQGYVMVKGKKTNKRLKVRVKTSDSTLNYDLNNNGEYEVFPLQEGSGKYEISVYENINGNKYKAEGSVALTAKIPDPLTCFLYPNQYVNYTEETPCVVKANEICAGITNPEQVYDQIKKFISDKFGYDFLKATTISAGILPDINGCWEKRMGICQDLSALAVAMMRSQGIPAKLVIGEADGQPHAWVKAHIGGETRNWDPAAKVTGTKHKSYKAERYY